MNNIIGIDIALPPTLLTGVSLRTQMLFSLTRWLCLPVALAKKFQTRN